MRFPPVALVAAAALVQSRVGRRPTGPSVAASAPLVVVAAWLGAGAVQEFVRRGTTVDPVSVDRASTLVRTGPNAVTRNPMYVGLAVLLTAHAVARRSPVALLPVAGFVAAIDRWQIPAEERALATRFEEYADYSPGCRAGCEATSARARPAPGSAAGPPPPAPGGGDRGRLPGCHDDRMNEDLCPGPTNSLVDVAGVAVGHHQRVGDGWLTGSTVVLAPPEGAVAGCDVRGGGPGTRETDLLDPCNLVERVHAVSLSGGSAFGLAAADGIMRWLLRQGHGFEMGGPERLVPIVPGAVIFDLGRGGRWDATPDAGFGAAACEDALRAREQGDGDHAAAPAVGTVGAGTGAQLAGGLKGGIGSASVVLPDGTTVAALVVLNAVGSTVDPRTGELYGASRLLPGDLDDLPGMPSGARLRTPDRGEVEAARERAVELGSEVLPRSLATTIGVVATDATLTEAQAQRLAMSGQDGLARAVLPAHSMFDGDTVFGLSTCGRPAPDALGLHRMLQASADVVTRAIVRATLAAESVTTPEGAWRSYREALPSAVG